MRRPVGHRRRVRLAEPGSYAGEGASRDGAVRRRAAAAGAATRRRRPRRPRWSPVDGVAAGVRGDGATDVGGRGAGDGGRRRRGRHGGGRREPHDVAAPPARRAARKPPSPAWTPRPVSTSEPRLANKCIGLSATIGVQNTRKLD